MSTIWTMIVFGLGNFRISEIFGNSGSDRLRFCLPPLNSDSVRILGIPIFACSNRRYRPMRFPPGNADLQLTGRTINDEIANRSDWKQLMSRTLLYAMNFFVVLVFIRYSRRQFSATDSKFAIFSLWKWITRGFSIAAVTAADGKNTQVWAIQWAVYEGFFTPGGGNDVMA